MKITEFKKEGTETRELSDLEIQKYADSGNQQAKLELAKKDYKLMTTDKQRVVIIAKLLGLTQ